MLRLCHNSASASRSLHSTCTTSEGSRLIKARVFVLHNFGRIVTGLARCAIVRWAGQCKADSDRLGVIVTIVTVGAQRFVLSRTLRRPCQSMSLHFIGLIKVKLE
jgi:hypothetical protein